MKITDAWIEDPAGRGRLESPYLCVQVDEKPDVTIAEENFAGGWTVGKYGPFVKYDNPANPDAGDFNIRFRNRFPPVVDIELQVFNNTGVELIGGSFALPLKRARQLVRKYANDWRLLVSDRNAEESGLLLWLPVQRNPVCKSWTGHTICGKQPARTVRVRDVDLPLCDDHIREHNEKHRLARTAS